MIDPKSLLYIDIETVGISKDFATLETEHPELAKLWVKNCNTLKKFNPEDVDLSCEELYVKRSGLYPEFGKIICFSYGLIKDGQVTLASEANNDEKAILNKINKILARATELKLTPCGHNIKFFDIPFIGKRMFINGIKPHNILPTWNTKPWDIKAVDTKDVWTFGTGRGLLALDTIATVMGIPSPKNGEVKADGVHDSYWNNNGLTIIKEYCERDVDTLIKFIEKLNILV